MKISQLKNCPPWLKRAKTKNADVKIINGIVHWHSGTWCSGAWYGGEWHNGIWERGTWYDGTWHRGLWEAGTWDKGIWLRGIWEKGTWKDGTWHNGTWYRGTWKDGTWKAGVWHYGTWETGHWLAGCWKFGTWEKGTWENGIWKDGTWNNGTWNNGTWECGTWHKGEQGVRSPYFPKLVANKQIKIGCKTKSRDEWDAWFEGTEEFCTSRRSLTFNLIHASYKGFITYVETLKLIPKKNENLRTKKLPSVAKKGKNKRR